MSSDIRRRSYSRRAAAGALAVVLGMLGVGCAGGNAPNAPSTTIAPGPVPQRPPAPPPLPPAQPGPPVAVLAVVEFRSGPGNNVHLILAETSRLSGATFSTPLLVSPTGNTDLGCPELHRVGPGQRWDMEASMSYCAPLGDGTRSGLTLIVEYSDDEGRGGTLTATMTEGQ